MNEWIKNAGRAEKRKLGEKSAAVHHRKMDSEKAEKFEEGDNVVVFEDGPNEVQGFIVEILPDDRITVENWNESVTVPARKVKKQ